MADIEIVAPASAVIEVDSAPPPEIHIAGGAQGPPGPTGSKGDKGDPGVKGDTGDTGAKGDQGDQGIQGIQGVKGDTGNTGAKGDTGDPGTPGSKGDKGDKGDQGIPGPPTTTLSASDQIVWAGDTNLYRGTNGNEVKTDDSLNVAGSVQYGQYAYRKVLALTFGTAANEKRDIFFTGGASFAIEITASGLVGGANAAGAIKVVYGLTGNSSGSTTYANTMRVLVADGPLATHFAFMQPRYDATNSRWTLPLAHLTTTANTVNLEIAFVGAWAADMTTMVSSLGVSAAYTTDATVPPVNAVQTLTATDKITWAGDTNIYRDAAGNALKTDDNLIVSGYIMAGTTASLDAGSKVSVEGSTHTTVTGMPSPFRVYQNVLLGRSGTPVTGTLKIVLPKAWTSEMMSFTIRGYDYQPGNGAWSVLAGGYSYAGGPSWVNTSVQISGRPPFTDIRFGYDGSKLVLLLGTTSTVWTYPNFVISEFRGFDTGWGSGWTYSWVTSEAGITNIASPYRSMPPGTLVGYFHAAANQAITPISTYVPVVLGTTGLDLFSGMQAGNSRYIPKVAGWYDVAAVAVWPANATGQRIITLMKNTSTNMWGGTAIVNPAPSGTFTQTVPTTPIQLNGTTDYIEMNAYQSAGATLDLYVSGIIRSMMRIVYLGP